MKKVLILLCFVLISACGNQAEIADVAKLNGYWEIEYAVLKTGEKIDYPVNETYDYFEMKGDKGKRAKVMPQFDGTFLTNGLFETVQIVRDKNKTYIDYSTFYTKWREEIIKIDDKELIMLNSEKNEYHYKKTGPINLTNGKKTP